MKSWRTVRLVPILSLMASVFIGGCAGGESDSRPRQAASGAVTLDGLPLPAGRIMLDPKSKADGIGAEAPIVDGKFSIGSAEGPTPGGYLVRVYAGAAVTAEMPTRKKLGDTKREIDTPAMKEPIPERYNTNTTLTADVKAGGPNDFKFELDSKPDPPAPKTATRRKPH